MMRWESEKRERGRRESGGEGECGKRREKVESVMKTTNVRRSTSQPDDDRKTR